MSTPTLEELAADLEATKASTPTLEEQLFSLLVPCWNNGADKLTAANGMNLLVAPIPLRILSVAIAWDYWSLPAHNSNYWKLELQKGAAGSYTTFATRTSQSTGANANGAIVADQAWTFDAAVWGDSDLSVGQMLRLVLSPVGTVVDLDMPFTATIRYRSL